LRMRKQIAGVRQSNNHRRELSGGTKRIWRMKWLAGKK
jgi:hypothetical protein